MAKHTNEEREDDREREAALLTDILRTRTADEWENFFQARHVPAARVRTLAEAVRDPQFATRGVTHITGLPPASTGLSTCRWLRSNSPMAARASRRRRPNWAPTPTACSPSTATTPARSRPFAGQR
jgi:crotonobetainyl-CoA:carnitine CoA-transferase CaiB-like acyl-CoA transferase